MKEALTLLDGSYRQSKRLAARYRRTGSRRNVSRPFETGHRRARSVSGLKLSAGEVSGPVEKGPGTAVRSLLVAEQVEEEYGIAIPCTTLVTGWWSLDSEAGSASAGLGRVVVSAVGTSVSSVQLDGSSHN